MKKLIVVLVVLMASCDKDESAAVIESNFDQMLDSLYQKHPKAIGFVLHIEAPDQNISWGGAVGYSNRDKKEPLKKEQPGQIGSITKTFVSASIFRLIEQEKLGLYQPIKSLLPERSVNLLESHSYPLDSITIGHLLSHRSSIPHSGTKKWLDKEVNDLKYRWSRDELISDAVTALERGKLGTFNYSDINYYLLTEIIEEVEETAFYLAIRELLKFEEIGLQHLWFYTLEPEPKGTLERFYQYRPSRDWASTYDESPNWGLWGGSGIVATAEDLAKFCQALASNKVFDKPETFNMMLTPMVDVEPAEGAGLLASPEQYASQYRMGITEIDGPGYKVYGHDGYWGSLMYHFPEQNVSFAFFGVNSEEYFDFDKFYRDILRNLN